MKLDYNYLRQTINKYTLKSHIQKHTTKSEAYRKKYNRNLKVRKNDT